MERCCICQHPIKGYGNNAEPYKKGICCDRCDSKYVIPFRMISIEIWSQDKIDLCKQVRNETGSCMSDIKMALISCNWNVQKAIDFLRELSQA